MKHWNNCIDGENIFLQKVVEKRISELIPSFSEENLEYNEEIDRNMSQKLEEIVADALLEANNSPEDLYTVLNEIQTFFLEILSNPCKDLGLNDENIESQADMLALFVKDSSFQLIQYTYQGLYQKKLPIPTDVDKRLKIRKNNIKKTGRPGIDPQGLALF